MLVGGNSKAKAFFKAYGIPDTSQGEAKYKTKVAEDYKSKITKMAEEYRKNNGDSSNDASEKKEPTNSYVSSPKKEISKQTPNETIQVYQKVETQRKTGTVTKRFFDGFSDDEWEKDDFDTPEPEQTIKEEPLTSNNEKSDSKEEEEEEVRAPIRSSRFMYSDSIADNFGEPEKEKKSNSLYSELNSKEIVSEEEQISRHGLFDDSRPKYQKKVVRPVEEDTPQLNPKLKNFENAKSISSKQVFEDQGFSNPSRGDPRLSKFSGSNSISSADYHGRPVRYDDEIDLKEVGRSIVKKGKKFVEWLNDLIDEE